jgi:hypothetical protein
MCAIGDAAGGDLSAMRLAEAAGVHAEPYMIGGRRQIMPNPAATSLKALLTWAHALRPVSAGMAGPAR